MTKDEFKRSLMHSFRLYFAPLVGAIRGAVQAVQDEHNRYEHEQGQR